MTVHCPIAENWLTSARRMASLVKSWARRGTPAPGIFITRPMPLQRPFSTKPIRTAYRNHVFRSRVEARYAVAFDSQEIDWDYELEGYPLPSGWYLPDFYLPQVNMFAEVKSGPFSFLELLKCKELADATKVPCLLLSGPPKMAGYWSITPSDCHPDYWPGYSCEMPDGLKIRARENYLFHPDKHHLAGGEFRCLGPGGTFPDPIDLSDGGWSNHYCDQSVIKTACSAKFEHGENG